MWEWVLPFWPVVALLLLAWSVHRWEKGRAKRHAKFLKQVQEELSRLEEKET